MSADRNKKILITLAAVWAGLIVFNTGIFKGDSNVQKAKQERKKTPVKETRKISLVKPRLDLLERPQPQYAGVKRDIFSPLKPAVPKAVAPPVQPLPVPVQVIPPPPKPKLPSALEIFTAQARFMGFVDKGDGRTVFLSRDPEVYLVKKGDTINGIFKVSDVTDAFLVLKGPDGEEARVELKK